MWEVQPKEAGSSKKKKLVWLDAYLERGRELLKIESSVQRHAVETGSPVRLEVPERKKVHVHVPPFDAQLVGTSLGKDCRLRIIILLEWIESSSALDLDMEANVFTLEVEGGEQPCYLRLVITIDGGVDEDSLSAKFDNRICCLIF